MNIDPALGRETTVDSNHELIAVNIINIPTQFRTTKAVVALNDQPPPSAPDTSLLLLSCLDRAHHSSD